MLKYFSRNAEMHVVKHTQYSNFGGKRGILHSSLLQSFPSVFIRLELLEVHSIDLVEMVRGKEYLPTVLCLSVS